MRIDRYVAYLVHADGLLPVQARLFSPEAALLLLRAYSKHNVSRLPIWALIRLSLEDHLVPFRRTGSDVERVRAGVIDNLLATTVRALLLDDLAASTALITRCLRGGKHACKDLLLLQTHAGASACMACVDIVVGCGAGTTTVVAQDLLLDHELVL